MIVSNSNKYIFVHITKAAGTSIKSMLGDSLEWNDVVLGKTKKGEHFNQLYCNAYKLDKHSYAADIRKVVGEEIWGNYFTFSFVRNPYARIVSLYSFIENMINARGIEKYFRNLQIYKNRRHEMWQWPVTQAVLETRNFSEFIRNKNFLKARGAQPQVSWILDDRGECIIDYIGKVECLNENYRDVTNKIGIENSDIEKKNVSNKYRQLKKYFASEEDYQYLHNLYNEDFQFLGYDPSMRF